MLRVTFKNVVAHKFRSIALVLTVVLGVSFVTGTYVLTDTITKVFDDIFTEAFASLDVTVRSQSELGTDAARTPTHSAPAVSATARCCSPRWTVSWRWTIAGACSSGARRPSARSGGPPRRRSGSRWPS